MHRHWRFIIASMWRWSLVLLVLMTACNPVKQAEPFTVITHPDGPLYAGDQVSFEIVSADSTDVSNNQVQVSIEGRTLASAGFGPYGVGGRNEAIFWWAWDTHELQPGSYTLTFTLLPEGPEWENIITLHPADEIPSPGPSARWTSTTSNCCTIYYISGTNAARDIETLRQITDTQAAGVEDALDADFNGAVTISFLPRTLGQGGFTTESIYVSYLDQNYAGSTTAQVLHHEMTHLLDAQLGGGYRPVLFVEGLAVYISGGHFKPEPILPRAAALSGLGWYIPLEKLADDFYPQQHETGYLEAAALIAYMVQVYGWPAFNDFYRHIPDPGSLKPSQAINRALKERFGISFSELEQNFKTYLKSQPVTEDIRTDLRLTVQFYDTVRRYQQGLDPSAYYMTAWLPDGKSMRERGIVADFLRHPRGFENRLLESMLVGADRNLRAGNYTQVEWSLRIINVLLSLTDH